MIVTIDFEFTGLNVGDVPISFAAVAENGKELYIEFVEHRTHNLSSWIKENVIPHLWALIPYKEVPTYKNLTYRYTDFENSKLSVISWFNSLGEDVTIVTDVGHYDWVWFCAFFGGALNLPKNISILPKDFNYEYAYRYSVSLDYVFQLDRKKLAGPDAISLDAHNALDDAKILMMAYRRVLE